MFRYLTLFPHLGQQVPFYLIAFKMVLHLFGITKKNIRFVAAGYKIDISAASKPFHRQGVFMC